MKSKIINFKFNHFFRAISLHLLIRLGQSPMVCRGELCALVAVLAIGVAATSWLPAPSAGGALRLRGGYGDDGGYGGGGGGYGG